MNIEGLAEEMSVLARAVRYKNLSGAADNVGISQPQLSRIVSRLESELRVSLLDRASKRKSSWTPIAHQLAEAYLRSVRSLGGEIQSILSGSEPKILHVGTLEGLAPLALEFGKHLLSHTQVRILDLDVFDLNVLEEFFFKGELDLIFTAREPGTRKFKYQKLLGYQSVEEVDNAGEANEVRVMSSFEYGAQRDRLGQVQSQAASTRPSDRLGERKLLISNSLSIRRTWLETYGGRGTLPLDVRATPRSKDRSRRVIEVEQVYLYAQDYFSDDFWEKMAEFRVPR